MAGKDAYNRKIIKRINNIIANNPDKNYLKGFLAFLSEMSYSSLYTYLTYTVNFLNYINKNIKDIDFDDYTNYMFLLKDKSPSYQKVSHGALKKFSEYLYVSGKVEKDYMSFVKRPKAKETQITKDKREKNYLTENEIKEYLNNVTGYECSIGEEWKARNIVIVYILLTTGMRCSALYKVDIDDIDLKNKTITVTDKGDKVITYYITEELDTYLTEWLDYRKDIVEERERALLISEFKGRMSQSAISRVVEKYGEGIKGKKLSPHKLRATYGTQLYNATKDIIFVQKAMNHSSSRTTELYIRGKRDESKIRAADIMAKLTN